MVSGLVGSVVLIVGGARSGKSRFAQELALRAGGSVLYVATAELRDEEMRQRAAAHRAERPASWVTVEEPLHLSRAVDGSLAEVVIVDCLTLWVSNVLERCGASGDPVPPAAVAAARSFAREELERVFEARGPRNLLLVSNEVGQGIVPAGALARVYRDLLGEVNQLAAARADRVYLMVAGLPIDVRRLADPAG
ncbi:MAG: bifunctional adenosylcobinamide kinase/adenosylcobinamide-phosphate guanylyltransferase [Chloroflexota bacterium]|nr:bifunctional adenosylcobinamide kinase/adenosylcobinamide-phosphate guanylyltransferase [Chloroflexota bacterium]